MLIFIHTNREAGDKSWDFDYGEDELEESVTRDWDDDKQPEIAI